MHNIRVLNWRREAKLEFVFSTESVVSSHLAVPILLYR